MPPRILFVGYGRAGKDEACEHVAFVSGEKNAGTTSKYLTKYVARVLRVSEEHAYANRHHNRGLWKAIGDEVRRDDPAKLIREALAVGPISGGVRDKAELDAARRENLVDLIVWVRNDRVPVDPTVTFAEADCDLTVVNNGTLAEYHRKLTPLAETLYGARPC